MGYDSLLIDARIGADPVDLLAQLRRAAASPSPAAVLIDPGSRKRVDGLKAGGFDAYLVRPLRRASLIRIAEHLAAPERGFEIDPGDLKPAPPSTARRRRQVLEVLLVEDDEINALLVRAVLERLGHGVTEVHDGRSAIEAVAADTRFDVILLDLNLPETDGFEAAAAIRAHERDSGRAAAMIFAVTADAGAETRQRATAAGCDAVLVKPVEPDVLRQALAGLKPAAAA
jgi:CheY-like chemotaxis protein